MMPQDPGAMSGGGGMPPQAQPPEAAGQPQQVDMQMVVQYFQTLVQSLVATGMPQDQALQTAMQAVANKFGPQAAQQLQMAATQGSGAQAPAAEGPGTYGPPTGGATPPGM
jgi:hypothetical protein